MVRFAEPAFGSRVLRAAIAMCFFAALALQPPVRAAEPAPPLEYQVKAAFLLNFTAFIDWPSPVPVSAPESFDICILGDDPFGAVLDQMLEGETRQGRKLAVQRVRRPVPPSCRILFVGKTEKDLGALLSALGPGVLTVGDETGFLRAGGMIGFVVENRRVRFDINEAAAARAGLKISSKLLSVARSVEK
jgi:YfiR/HmsC-like